MRNKRIYNCKELNCNNEICYETWKNGKGRCMSCAHKGENNGKYGKENKWGHHTEESKQKMSDLAQKDHQ